MKIKVVIIGVGISGVSIVCVLSKYENLEVYLIEKVFDVGWGVSKVNIVFIYGGYDDDFEKYLMRVKFCIRGNCFWY